MSREEKGRWTDVVKPEFNRVLVHASLLPNGKVLYWGRRPNPKAQPPEWLDQPSTQAFLWDPPTWEPPPWDPSAKRFGESKPKQIDGSSKPANKGQDIVNLFCSGHCLLPDGNLLVVGGHIKDTWGLRQSCIYNYQTDEFKPQTEMNNGRWYPSALPLPDGRVFAISGSYHINNTKDDVTTNNIPQIWSPNDPNGPWTEVAAFPPSNGLPLYPRVHLHPNGRQVIMVGPLEDSWLLELKDKDGKAIKDDKDSRILGRWTPAGLKRNAGPRDYAPSVMYDSGKIVYIGGGNGDGGPTTQAEYIDLNADKPEWKMTNMKNQRRQFNATVLPDGTVLVTGGTRAGPFNNLDGTNPVHEAELWNPVNDTWTTMMPENSDRCYHSIALLLPDGRVLSAGGGEYGDADPPKRQGNLTDGQLFEPPYLFKGPRPTIKSAPKEINYGKPFPVTVDTADSIKRVSLIRLGSVTHCRNMNQSLMFLEPFTPGSPTLTVPAPADENHAPPGHYMLFVLNKEGVPSVASIVHVAAASAKTTMRVADTAAHPAVAKQIQPTLVDYNETIITEQARPPVVVGLTPVCPYGLGGCWGGAHDALQRLSDIEVVRPVPDQVNSLAFVYPQQDILPDLDVWRAEFEKATNKGYDMRGIEITISGVGTKKQIGDDEQLTLAGTSSRPELVLAPFQASSQLRWDMKTQAPKPIIDAESGAYKRLWVTLANYPKEVVVQVTGTLQKQGADEFSLDVRDFEIIA